MERTITAKSICQWTAAATLVAIGSLSFLSARTLEKLSQNGDVSFDTQAFRKLGSVSLALDRTEEQKLIHEEDRLIEKASFAHAEALPVAAVRFSKIQLPTKKALKAKRFALQSKTAVARPKSAESALTAEERNTIAALEKAPDPALESLVLANLYRRVRFQFVAAVDHSERKNLIAQDLNLKAKPMESVGALEYDEVPVLDGSDFEIPAAPAEEASVAIETAPEKSESVPVVVAAKAAASDAIQNTSSATAKAGVFLEDPVPPSMSDSMRSLLAQDSENKKEKSQNTESLLAPRVYSEGLDGIPEVTAVTTQVAGQVISQTGETKQATGPPEGQILAEKTSPASLATSPAQSTPSLDSAPTLIAKNTATTPPQTPETAPVTTQEAADYPTDLSAVFGDGYGHPTEGPSDYSGLSSEDEYSDRAMGKVPDGLSIDDRKALALASGNYSEDAANDSHPVSAADSSITDASNAGLTEASASSTKEEVASAPIDLGSGVSKDSKGITISWNKTPVQTAGIQVSLPSKNVPPVVVQAPVRTPVPNAGDSGEVDTDQDKIDDRFSFTPPPAEPADEKASDPEVPAPVTEGPKGKCDTEKLGVEAFNPAAEKETLSVCRRALSQEGHRAGAQARWMEAYNPEGEYWPTLIYQRPKDALEQRDRVPMLSNASIRILSMLSRANTHTGMGILFGEIPKGLSIRLVGRSDAPIYLDSGMKLQDTSADPTAKRQFVFLNVAPGQPLLSVTDSEKNRSGAIPVVVKAGIATFVRVPEPTEMEATFVILDASAAKENHLKNVTGEIVGQSGRMGISDKKGVLKISKVVTFGDYPIYIDLIQNEKSYKNRYRLSSAELKNHPLFFFDEKRANHWIGQLAGGVSPYSGMIAGVVPSSALSPKESTKDASKANHLRIGTFEKKSSLVPERYLLDSKDNLVSESKVQSGFERFVGVQIPEGVSIPSVIDAKGELVWSELVYAQPGVINVVGP